MRIYLAGPDVFLPEPEARARVLRDICRRHGVVGVSPLDRLAKEPPAIQALALPLRIAARNEAHMRGSDALIANLTPFRGPSADAGTVYEVGFMRALGRPVFGWSNTARPLAERTLDAQAGGARLDASGTWRDAAGMQIEAFGLADNLMIDGGIALSGGRLVLREVAAERRWTDLDAFALCVAAAARLMAGG